MSIPANNAGMEFANVTGRVGTYAISIFDFESWVNEPTVQVAPRSRKTKGAKQMINKIFNDCAEIIDDQFWADKFRSAAYGTFPRGFSFHDDILIYSKGAKTQTLEVSGNPYEAAYACMEFFRSNAGIFSPTDEKQSSELQYLRSQSVLTQEKLTWGNINKKMQECMLSNYITYMKEMMNLCTKEMEQLREIIKMGILNKYFGKTNITVDNNRIFSIDGLLWNSDKREFYINPELKPIITRTYNRKKDGPPSINQNQKDTIPQFSIKWDKYIKILEKKQSAYTRRIRRSIVHHQPNHVHYLTLIPTTDTVTTTLTDDTTNDYTDTESHSDTE